MITRFAPSPTGRLHLGHAYSALLAWQWAQEAKGRFLLRFEDIDHTRVREEFYEGIEVDLDWLGMSWETPAWRQLNRLANYERALEQLRAMGLLYRCFCTRKDLMRMDAPQEGEGSALYPGFCRHLTDEEVAEKLAKKIPYCWRLRSDLAGERVGPLQFVDKRFGSLDVRPELLGDVVVARKDIATSYHLAVVVDDAAQEVSHIVRGEDLLESTHIHRILQELLGFPEPEYWHHELVVDGEGKRLAKRHDALAIATLREEGASREEVWERALSQVRQETGLRP